MVVSVRAGGSAAREPGLKIRPYDGGEIASASRQENVRARWNRANVKRALFIVAGTLVAVLAAAHALFAASNFGLSQDEDDVLSVPLGEGILALVAALALALAALLLFRRRLFNASIVALAGTIPLPIFFAFTVPEHSGWIFLFASMVIPAVAAATAFLARQRAPS